MTPGPSSCILWADHFDTDTLPNYIQSGEPLQPPWTWDQDSKSLEPGGKILNIDKTFPSDSGFTVSATFNFGGATGEFTIGTKYHGGVYPAISLSIVSVAANCARVKVSVGATPVAACVIGEGSDFPWSSQQPYKYTLCWKPDGTITFSVNNVMQWCVSTDTSDLLQDQVSFSAEEFYPYSGGMRLDDILVMRLAGHCPPCNESCCTIYRDGFCLDPLGHTLEQDGTAWAYNEVEKRLETSSTGRCKTIIQSPAPRATFIAKLHVTSLGTKVRVYAFHPTQDSYVAAEAYVNGSNGSYLKLFNGVDNDEVELASQDVAIGVGTYDLSICWDSSPRVSATLQGGSVNAFVTAITDTDIYYKAGFGVTENTGNVYAYFTSFSRLGEDLEGCPTCPSSQSQYPHIGRTNVCQAFCESIGSKGTPKYLKVVLSGFGPQGGSELPCSDCADINGTYILPFLDIYSYVMPPSRCPPFTTDGWGGSFPLQTACVWYQTLYPIYPNDVPENKKVSCGDPNSYPGYASITARIWRYEHGPDTKYYLTVLLSLAVGYFVQVEGPTGDLYWAHLSWVGTVEWIGVLSTNELANCLGINMQLDHHCSHSGWGSWLRSPPIPSFHDWVKSLGPLCDLGSGNCTVSVLFAP